MGFFNLVKRKPDKAALIRFLDNENGQKLVSRRLLLVINHVVPDKVVFVRLDQTPVLLLDIDWDGKDLGASELARHVSQFFPHLTVANLADITAALISDTVKEGKK